MKGRSAFAFLTPILAIFTLFSLLPLALSILLSFLDWSPLNPERSGWVGLGHYARALPEPRFWGALRNTFVFVAGTIPRLARKFREAIGHRRTGTSRPAGQNGHVGDATMRLCDRRPGLFGARAEPEQIERPRRGQRE